MTYNIESLYLSDLLEQIDKGNIQMNSRDLFHYHKRNILRLLDNIKTGYPIGHMVLLEYDYKTVFLVDGLKRINTLYSVLYFPDGTDSRYKINYDTKTDEFVYDIDNCTIPLTSFRNLTDYWASIRTKDAVVNNADQLYDRIQRCKIAITRIRCSPEESSDVLAELLINGSCAGASLV